MAINRPDVDMPFNSDDSQNQGFRPGPHEDDSQGVSGRLDHTAGRNDSRAEGAEPSLHRPSATDKYAHSRSKQDRRGY